MYVTRGLSGMGAVTGATRDQVRAIQLAAIAAGCSVGPTGADGIWGPRTQGGVECLARKIGSGQMLSQYPVIRSLMPQMARIAPGLPTLNQEAIAAITAGVSDEVPAASVADIVADVTAAATAATTPPDAPPRREPSITEKSWFWPAVITGGVIVVGGTIAVMTTRKEEI